MIDFKKLNKKTNRVVATLSVNNSFVKNINLNKSLVDNFMKEILLKNWNIDNKIVKEYTHKNETLQLILPNGDQKATKDVFLNSIETIELKDDLFVNLFEIYSCNINPINFSAKQKYHDLKIKNVTNISKDKIEIQIIDNKIIKIIIEKDHDIDITLRKLNEIISLIANC